MGKQLTFLDLCSGIGGFRLGLETAGHKCIGFCEYDKFAVASYRAMYDTEGEWYAEDVTKIKPTEIPRADIWCFGFPCQDISVAGKQRGLVGKRSGIYFNIIDLLKSQEESNKPTYLLVENVKNLLSINSGFDFATVLSEMDEAGYDCRWQVLNSKNFGVPQNRERVFIIANLRSRGRREVLPLCGENAATLNQLIGGMQGYRVYDVEGISSTLVGNGGGVGAKTGLYLVGNINPSGKGQSGNVYDTNGIAPALCSEGGGSGAKTGLYLMGNLNPSGKGQGGNVYHEDGIAPTITVNKGCGTRIFVDQSNTEPKITKNARCLTARYTSGMVNRKASNSAVMEVHPVLTPERMKKRQNGRRMKEDGEPMFTLTSQDRHGVYICETVEDDEIVLKVRNGTKKGYDEAHIGDSISLAYPESKTRRGRVGKKLSQTIDCQAQMGTLMKCGRIRRLTPRECFRLQGFPDELFDKAASINSDAQLYKQAGNAVTATVAFAVAMSLPESR